jgi:hypothetical protein
MTEEGVDTVEVTFKPKKKLFSRMADTHLLKQTANPPSSVPAPTEEVANTIRGFRTTVDTLENLLKEIGSKPATEDFTNMAPDFHERVGDKKSRL